MSYGLRVWNPSGVLVLNTGERLSQVYAHGSFVVTATNPVYSWRTVDVNVAGLVNDGSFLVFIREHVPTYETTLTELTWPTIYNGYFQVKRYGVYQNRTCTYTIWRR